MEEVMNEIIETAQEGLPMVADDQLVALVAQAEKRIEAFNKLKGLALRLTNSRDWIAQGDNPYMTASAADKIGSFFGVSWHIEEPVCEHEEGGHYGYTYQGEFIWRGNRITAIGTRSSKDPFFKKYSYPNGTRTELPASEIDKGDVKKAAYTNCITNGVSRSLGIRNLTWDDLAVAGIHKDQIAAVDYKKNGKAATGIASEGAQKVTASVSDVRKTTGTNAKTKKPWTKFVIKCGEIEYGTFSESNAKIAKDALEAGLQVEIGYTTGQFGNDIESIKKCEPATERSPGEEG
jgi:hypothetical protein